MGSRDDFLAMMVSAMESSGLQPVVDRVHPFDELYAAMAGLQLGQHVGKVCLQF